MRACIAANTGFVSLDSLALGCSVVLSGVSFGNNAGVVKSFERCPDKLCFMGTMDLNAVFQTSSASLYSISVAKSGGSVAVNFQSGSLPASISFATFISFALTASKTIPTIYSNLFSLTGLDQFQFPINSFTLGTNPIALSINTLFNSLNISIYIESNPVIVGLVTRV